MSTTSVQPITVADKIYFNRNVLQTPTFKESLLSKEHKIRIEYYGNECSLAQVLQVSACEFKVSAIKIKDYDFKMLKVNGSLILENNKDEIELIEVSGDVVLYQCHKKIHKLAVQGIFSSSDQKITWPSFPPEIVTQLSCISFNGVCKLSNCSLKEFVAGKNIHTIQMIGDCNRVKKIIFTGEKFSSTECVVLIKKGAIFCNTVQNGYVTWEIIEESREFLEKAEEHACYANAYYNLAKKYYDQKEYEQALIWYKKSARNGCAYAATDLGFMYAEGHGATKDGKKALYWTLIGAKRGCMDAQYNLGRIYELGLFETAKQEKHARKWYKKAAANGCSKSGLYLGIISYKSEQYIKALKWYEKAAEMGNPDAMCNLGQMYEKGDGVQQNGAIALNWYEKAIKHGNVNKTIKLDQICNEEQDKAVQCEKSTGEQRVASLVKDSNNGNVDAMFKLGKTYEIGDGIAQDEAIALEWYEKAAQNDHIEAMFKAGSLHYRKQNIKNAMKYYHLAANQGCTKSQFNLGYIYNFDQVHCNYSLAIKWYTKAAEKNVIKAMYNLGYMYYYISCIQDKKKAIDWLQKAAEKDHATAKILLQEIDTHFSTRGDLY